MLRNVYVSMGEVNETDLLLMSNTPWLVLLLHITWIVVANVLMMNLLIGMMSNTVDDGLQVPSAPKPALGSPIFAEDKTLIGHCSDGCVVVHDHSR
jgi:hypothetical protein